MLKAEDLGQPIDKRLASSNMSRGVVTSFGQYLLLGLMFAYLAMPVLARGTSDIIKAFGDQTAKPEAEAASPVSPVQS